MNRTVEYIPAFQLQAITKKQTDPKSGASWKMIINTFTDDADFAHKWFEQMENDDRYNHVTVFANKKPTY